MINRKIPYGYQMRNGKIEIVQIEATIVQRIFQEYIGGLSLKKIAEQLTGEQIEYLPGEFLWNKNRIKRILEDTRYSSNTSYPQIINSDTQEKSNHFKELRNSQKDTLVTAEKKRLTHTVHCGECRNKMVHRTDRRLKHVESWSCKTCSTTVKITIEDVEKQITNLLNQVIAAPDKIGCSKSLSYEPSLEVRKLENEITRLQDQYNTDTAAFRDLILLCAEKKYEENITHLHITERLKADFEKRNLLSKFSIELYENTASATMLYPDGTVSVVLKDKTVLRKECKPNVNNSHHNSAKSSNNSGRPEEST